MTYVRQIFSPYAKRKRQREHYGYCMTWYRFSSWFNPYGVKVLSFFYQKILYFSQSQIQCFDGSSVHISLQFNYYEFAMFTKCIFIVIKIFTCFYGVWVFYVFPVIILCDIKWCFRLTNTLNLAHDTLQ